MSSDVTLGSIYWPITQPLNILRSEKIPFPSSELFSNSREVYCPHLIFDDDNKSYLCMLKNKQDNKCGYKGSSGTLCDYDDYHNLFLLLEKRSNNGNRDSLKPFDEIPVPSPKTYSDLYYSSNHTHFATTLNAFPQTDQSKLIGWKVFNSPLNDGVFFNIPPSYTEGTNQLNADGDLGNLGLGKNDIVYAKTELLRLEKMDDIDAFMDAFLLLVKKDKIKKLLPPDKIEKAVGQQDIVLPVQLSFFADKKIDAILALSIRTKESDIIKNAKLVRQALGSMREVIYNQRQEFLEKWCMRLGERVDDIVQNNNPENHDQAIKEAMKFAFKAIFNMAQTLAVQHSGCNIKKISDKFDYETDKKKKNPEQIFKCIYDNFIGEFDKNCVDRKKYVINFCKKAEMYAEEFVLSDGKLKGRLSAPTVRELKRIAHTSNPVNARILIRGEPGGGKGATAEDFHFYCMKRIAKNIKDIISERNKDTEKRREEIAAESDSVHKEEKEKNLKDEDLKHLIENNKYLKEVMNNLNSIFKLPSIFGENESVLKTKFFLRQISNTGWWLWNRDPKPGENIKDHLKYNLYNSSIQLNSPVGDEKVIMHYYVGLLKDKILFEDSSKKPDWSFNFLQVNCGILGGENSELAEAIERLFGKSGSNKTTMPGIFQTCSYMGGTLFLDEIADAPVRVQDNLLRPLEEGKVSRPGWETFDEKVDNIRIVGATFKDLFTLAQQYQETLLSEKTKGFRPDLLTRLRRNPPVYVTPICNYFVPTEPIDEDFPSQFAFVLNNSWLVSSEFWREVYDMVSKQIDKHCPKALPHNLDKHEARRKFASKITMRLFKEVGKIAQLNNNPKLPDNNFTQKNKALEYLNRMLDYLLVETS